LSTPRSVLSVLSCVAIASSGLGCSLLAPSDAELMGGGAHDAAGDAGDGGAHDGSPGADAACLAAGEFCNGMPTQCCSHTCNGAAGKKCD
jgi:hypothetical protein